MDRTEKKAFVDDFNGKLRSAQLVVLADYTGLNVETMNRLRRQLEASGNVEFVVVKNSLCERAIAGTAMESLTKHLTGPTAVLMGFNDPVGPAKALTAFIKEVDKLKVKAGFFGGKILQREDLVALSTMPPKDVVLGQLLGTLQAPLVQIVSVLNAVPQQVLGVIQAYKDKLEKGDA